MGLGSAIAVLISVNSAEAASLYSAVSLPFIPSDLNDQGQVVGQQYLWDNGNLTDLGSLAGAAGSSISARAINNQGTIVGGGLVIGDPSIVQPQAFRSDGKTISSLGIFGSSICQSFCSKTTAIAINEAGDIGFNLEHEDFQAGGAGYVQRSQNPQQFIYTGERISDLNNRDQAVGFTIARGRSGPGQGTIQDIKEGEFRYLDAPGYCAPFRPCFNRVPPGTNSGNPFDPSTEINLFSASTQATAVNDLGQVVGSGPIERVRQSPIQALVWNKPFEDAIGVGLGTLGGVADANLGRVSSAANSINNAGQIVGFSYTPDSEQRAVLWEDGNLIDLNGLISGDAGWKLASAAKINNRGQIVGTGYRDGQQQGFLLTAIDDSEPVPEPDSRLATGVGAGALFVWYRTKKIRKQKRSAKVLKPN